MAVRRPEFSFDDGEFEKLLTGGHTHAQMKEKLERKYGSAVLGVCVNYLKEQRRSIAEHHDNATSNAVALATASVIAPVNAIYSRTQPGKMYVPGTPGHPPAWVVEEGYVTAPSNAKPRAGSVGRR